MPHVAGMDNISTGSSSCGFWSEDIQNLHIIFEIETIRLESEHENVPRCDDMVAGVILIIQMVGQTFW